MERLCMKYCRASDRKTFGDKRMDGMAYSTPVTDDGYRVAVFQFLLKSLSGLPYIIGCEISYSVIVLLPVVIIYSIQEASYVDKGFNCRGQRSQPR